MGGRSSKDSTTSSTSSSTKRDDLDSFEDLLSKWQITPLDLLRPLTDETISHLQIDNHISSALALEKSDEERRNALVDATPIHIAAELENVRVLEDMVKAILEYSHKKKNEYLDDITNGDPNNFDPGIDWNVRDAQGLSPLSRAVRNQTVHAVQLLIDVGADPFEPYCTTGSLSKERWTWSYLRYAAWHGKAKSLEALLTVKEISEGWGPDGKRPIHLAVENGQLESVEILLQHDLLKYCNDQNELTAEYALQSRRLAVDRFIVRAPGFRLPAFGMSPRYEREAENESERQEQAQTLAVRSQQTNPHDLLEILRGVLQSEITPSIDSQPGTQEEPVTTLAPTGASNQVFVSRDRGSSLLHLAATYGQNDILEYLLKHAAFANTFDTLNEFGKAPIFMAVRHGHMCCLKTLQKHGVGIESTDIEKWSTVHEAVKYRHIDILNYLIDNGCSVNSSDDDGWTPLHVAARFGAFTAVQPLISAGASIDAKTDDNETALKLAVMQTSNDTLLQELLRYGPDMRMNFAQHPSQSPIRVLLERRDFSMLNILLAHMQELSKKEKEYLKDINRIFNDNSAILHRCVSGGAVAVVRRLMQMGADESVKNSTGEPPIYYAARKDMVRVLCALLECNANPDEAHRDGTRPIHVACDFGHRRVVEVLLAHGSDAEYKVPETAPNGGFTPLMLASRRGHSKCVGILKQFGVDLNTQKGDGYTALHLAALNGHIDALKVLLRAGADQTIAELHGFLPLHVAVRNQQFDATAALLADGADSSAPGPAGLTALHFAAHVCDARAVWLLLQCGVSVLSTDDHGASALHYCARQARGQSCLQLLLTCGAYVNAADDEGDCALHCAAQAGVVQNVRILLKRGADARRRNEIGLTALHIAVAQGSELVVGVLLKFGANGRDKDHNGTSAYQLATRARNQAARLLIWRALGHSVDDVAAVSKYDVRSAENTPIGSPKNSIDLTSMIKIDEGREICVVCQSVLSFGEDVRVLPCSHTYHSECILGWFGGETCEDHDYCPLCHLSILPNDVEESLDDT